MADMTPPQPSGQPGNRPETDSQRLRVLTPEQVAKIDELLKSVGEYGEVHLIVQHGELRYINRVESHKAWDDNRKK